MLDCLLIFSTLTSHGEFLQGKSKDFKAFHNSFGLPMGSFDLFSKLIFFYWKSTCVPYIKLHYMIPH